MSAFGEIRTLILRALRTEGHSHDAVELVRGLPTPGRAAADAELRRALPLLLASLRSASDVGPAYRMLAGLLQELGGAAVSPARAALFVALDGQRTELVTALYLAGCAVAGHRVQDLPELEGRGSAAEWVGALAVVRAEVEGELAGDFDADRMRAQRRALELIGAITAALSAEGGSEAPCEVCEAFGCSTCGGLRGTSEPARAA